jgi:hypothetical protein
VVHAEDHGSSGEEKKTLEEGVREEVEHRERRRDSKSRAGHHVAKLRDCGVGEDALDVILLGGKDTGT